MAVRYHYRRCVRIIGLVKCKKSFQIFEKVMRQQCCLFYSLFLQSLYKMLEGMGNRPSGDPKVRAKDIFSTIDVNQDGTLTKDEFIKGLCLNLQNEH